MKMYHQFLSSNKAKKNNFRDRAIKGKDTTEHSVLCLNGEQSQDQTDRTRQACQRLSLIISGKRVFTSEHQHTTVLAITAR